MKALDTTKTRIHGANDMSFAVPRALTNEQSEPHGDAPQGNEARAWNRVPERLRLRRDTSLPASAAKRCRRAVA